jgi:hypothetical protein
LCQVVYQGLPEDKPATEIRRERPHPSRQSIFAANDAAIYKGALRSGPLNTMRFIQWLSMPNRIANLPLP